MSKYYATNHSWSDKVIIIATIISKPNRALPFRNEEELFPNDENKCRELLFVFKYFFKVELMKNPLGVMSHSTATFVVQKLMEMCEPSSLEMYMSIMEKYFLALSVHLGDISSILVPV